MIEIYWWCFYSLLLFIYFLRLLLLWIKYKDCYWTSALVLTQPCERCRGDGRTLNAPLTPAPPAATPRLLLQVVKDLRLDVLPGLRNV